MNLPGLHISSDSEDLPSRPTTPPDNRTPPETEVAQMDNSGQAGPSHLYPNILQETEGLRKEQDAKETENNSQRLLQPRNPEDNNH